MSFQGGENPNLNYYCLKTCYIKVIREEAAEETVQQHAWANYMCTMMCIGVY